MQNWEYPSLGINLKMEPESQVGDKIVRSITIVQPCKYTTSQDINISSDTKIVKEKYLKLIDASNSDVNTIVKGSIYGGTIFILKAGAVSKYPFSKEAFDRMDTIQLEMFLLIIHLKDQIMN